MNRAKQPDLFLYLLYSILFVSICCSFRVVSSIVTGALVLVNLIKNKLETGSFFNPRVKNIFLIACCLFYAVQLGTLWHTPDFSADIKDLSTKSALVFVPLAVCSSSFLHAKTWENLMKSFIWILAAMLLYCLSVASYHYLFTHAPADVFFYHALVIPFQQHAVQVSIYIFAGLVYLMEQSHRGVWFYNKPVHILLGLFVMGCIVLLSSKLVISFSIFCLLFYALLAFQTPIKKWFVKSFFLMGVIAAILLVLLTPNRISKRFGEILTGSLSLVKEKQFTPAVYFNGLQFRLLQWRFVAEILTEQTAWRTGVSNNAQELLDKKYTSTHMYTGDAGTTSHGYLSYNTHNQFLQSLLELGIPGLLAFILTCGTMIYLAIRRKSRLLSLTVGLLIAYCFNEAVFETQYGITLFTFFPLFIFYGTKSASGC